MSSEFGPGQSTEEEKIWGRTKHELHLEITDQTDFPGNSVKIGFNCKMAVFMKLLILFLKYI